MNRDNIERGKEVIVTLGNEGHSTADVMEILSSSVCMCAQTMSMLAEEITGGPLGAIGMIFEQILRLHAQLEEAISDGTVQLEVITTDDFQQEDEESVH